jgi:hypothetical protein
VNGCCTGNLGAFELQTSLNKAVYAANEVVQITIKMDTSRALKKCPKIKVALIQEFDLKFKKRIGGKESLQSKQNLFLLSVNGPNARKYDWVYNCYVDLRKLTETSYG